LIDKIALNAQSSNPAPYSSSHNHPVSLSVACQIVRAAEEARNPFKEFARKNDKIDVKIDKIDVKKRRN